MVLLRRDTADDEAFERERWLVIASRLRASSGTDGYAIRTQSEAAPNAARWLVVDANFMDRSLRKQGSNIGDETVSANDIVASHRRLTESNSPVPESEGHQNRVP